MRNLVAVLLIGLLSFNCWAQTEKAFSPKLGVCTSIKNHKIVAAAGFDYIEESVGRFLIPGKSEDEFEKNLAILRKSSIPIIACNGFLPGHLKTTGEATNHEEIIQYAETAFRRAKKAEIKNIVFGSSGSRNFPEGFSKDLALEQFASLLKQMGPIAEKYGIYVVIEPLRKEESNLINRVDEAIKLINIVDHPNIQVLGDVYHMTCENEEPESFIEARKMLKHVHLAEKAKRTAPGLEGDNFTPYLRALLQAGYNGGISIEGRWGDNFESNLIIARAYLQGQINSLN